MERELLYLKIYNDLLEGIQNGVYPPGSRLPSEKELAEEYEVSRITSKKALEMLALQSRIIRMPGKGSYVLESEKNEDRKLSDAEMNHGRTSAGGKKLIGLVVDKFDENYSTQIVCGVEHGCRHYDFDLILKCTYGSVEGETKALEDLLELNVQGIILMCVQDENYNEKVLKLFVDNFPIILVDRDMPGLPIPCVSTDNYKASRELMELLIADGHRSISYLSHHYSPNSVVSARFSGYLDSMLEHNLKTGEEWWIRDLDSRLPRVGDDEGEEKKDVDRIKDMVRKYPQVTGFFAVNFPVAMMAYTALKELGLEKEKEVVCFDGYEDESYFGQVFSHIAQGGFMIGERAVKYLRDRMKGKEVSQKKYVPYTLVERGKK